MRIAIKKTKVYKFSELTEDQKDKAISNLYDLNIDYEWWDSTFDDAEQVGLKITGFDIDGGSYCKGTFINGAADCAKAIIKSHGKTCETYKTAKAYLMERDQIIGEAEKDESGELVDGCTLDQKLDEIDAEFLKSLCEDYRIILQKEFEYLTSREAIIETIEANDYEFTENGKIY